MKNNELGKGTSRTSRNSVSLPQREKWMYEHKDQLGIPVLVGVAGGIRYSYLSRHTNARLDAGTRTRMAFPVVH